MFVRVTETLNAKDEALKVDHNQVAINWCSL